MKILNSVADVKTYISTIKALGRSIGFVPTMGALHEGHLSLIIRAHEDNDITVASIFVNPIQFNNKTDLAKYPRPIEKDIQKLEEIGCDMLFYPTVEEMYPEPVFDKYDFGQLDKVMEGKFRPGHFNGVAVVVRRLFDIVTPDKAYFGMKDYAVALSKLNCMKSFAGITVYPIIFQNMLSIMLMLTRKFPET